MIARLEALVDRAVHALAALGLAGLTLMAVGIVIDVLSRWLFNAPFLGMEDLMGLLIVLVVTLFFPAVLHDRGNIAINVVGRAFGRRGAEALDAFGHLVTFVFFVILAWQLFRHAADLEGRITQILELPVPPVWWIAAAIIACCVPIQLLVFIAHLRAALGGDSPRSRWVEPRP